MIRFEPAVPVLRIFSVEKTKEFYLGFLGFSLDWEHRFADGMPLHAQVSRDGLVLHVSEHHGDACPGSTVLVRMSGIEAFHRDLVAKDYAFAKPGLETAPWGAWVVEVTDPFGNRLRFSEVLRS